MIRPQGTTTIDLIRHGEPVGGTMFRGWQDDPLSETGWEQMRQAVGDQSPWEQIITSPLLRCYEFAKELGQRYELSLAVDERFKEIGFGAWEGRKPDELYQQDPGAVGRFWSDPVNSPPPGAESMTGFQARIDAAWHDLTDHYQGKHLLLVAHGGVNRMIIGRILGIPLSHLFRMDIPYAGISRILVDDGTPRLAFHCASLDMHGAG
ncbi:MAG: alpha-ribazole phosphatase family protein [Gammaproteobacteria bacterium]|nr:alpha-ribazole phosphatase family protein [Gammaproteobacteria bacterium]